jgi:hypothetical protein
METAMLHATLTALLTTLFLAVFLTVGTAVYVTVGMPGMSQMHSSEPAQGKAGLLGSERSWSGYWADKTKSN